MGPNQTGGEIEMVIAMTMMQLDKLLIVFKIARRKWSAYTYSIFLSIRLLVNKQWS